MNPYNSNPYNSPLTPLCAIDANCEHRSNAAAVRRLPVTRSLDRLDPLAALLDPRSLGRGDTYWDDLSSPLSQSRFVSLLANCVALQHFVVM
jgi:hypothetical protein